MKKFLLSAVLAMFGLAQSAIATSGYDVPDTYEIHPQGFGYSQNSLGLAAVYRQNIYIGVDNKVVPFPLINYTYKQLFIKGITAGYIGYVNDTVQASLIARPNFNGYDPNDSHRLNGMSEAHPSVNIGAQVMVRILPIMTTVEALHDISGNTAGNTYNLKLASGIPLNDRRLILSPSVTLSYQDKKVINYYYGVSTAESTETRAAYSPSGTLNATYALTALYQITPHWRGNLTYFFTDYGHEIVDSPITDRATSSTVLLGLSYFFD